MLLCWFLCDKRQIQNVYLFSLSTDRTNQRTLGKIGGRKLGIVLGTKEQFAQIKSILKRQQASGRYARDNKYFVWQRHWMDDCRISKIGRICTRVTGKFTRMGKMLCDFKEGARLCMCVTTSLTDAHIDISAHAPFICCLFR